MWVLRLSIIQSLPLSKEEYSDLAIFSGFTVDELKFRFDQIILKVEKREQQRMQVLGKAVLLWHEIRRLETLLKDKRNDPPENNQEIINNLKLEIEVKLKKRDECLKRGQLYS